MSKLIDGQLFCAMVIEGALSIEEKKDEANELNVFPVPDGDTGTNMSLTMASAKNEMSKQLDKDIDLATASKMTASVRAETPASFCPCCSAACPSSSKPARKPMVRIWHLRCRKACRPHTRQS